MAKVKSHFRGWVEVTQKQAERFAEVIREGATNIPKDKKDTYIATRVVFDKE